MSHQIAVRAIQAVLFTVPFTIDRKLDFATEFVRHNTVNFTSDPNIITAPLNAPPQMPTVEIKSPDQTHAARFFRDRIMFHYQAPGGHSTPIKPAYNRFSEALRPQIQCIMEFLNPKVTRLGFIMALFKNLGFSSNLFLSREVMKENPFPDAHEINMGILHKLNLENFSVNRWVRYRTLRASNDPSVDNAMAIEIDINTLAEDVNDFSTTSLFTYYDTAFNHVMTSLGQFPALDISSLDGGGEE